MKNLLNHLQWVYGALGVFFAFGWGAPAFPTIASLILLYGLPTGTLLHHKKEVKKFLVPIAVFIAVSFIGFFIR